MKKIIIGSLVALMVISTSAAPASAAPAITQAELDGCKGYNPENLVYDRLLFNDEGRSYGGEGKVNIYKKKVDGNWRICAIGLPPSGKTAFMKIKIGTREQGNTKNKVTWDKTERAYFDSGRVSMRIGGVALTPSDGRCAAVYTMMKKSGDKYDRKLTYDLCN